jgi:CO dehydrogenase/acetyl-CoA synthase beta subunit
MQVLDASKEKLPVIDMAPLFGRVREFLAEQQSQTTHSLASLDFHALATEFGFTGRRQGKPEVILANDMAIELGHPSTSSRAVILTTFQPELVWHNRIAVVGPDLDKMKREERYPFTQVVLLAIDPDRVPDPFELDNTQYLLHRLPGYMVRSIPGKLWVRISRAALARGLTLETVGAALISAFSREFDGVAKVEVIFVSTPHGIKTLEQVATEANILAGRHKKLALNVDGEVECVELNCGFCEEKVVCDNLRDIVIKRRGRIQ